MAILRFGDHGHGLAEDLLHPAACSNQTALETSDQLPILLEIDFATGLEKPWLRQKKRGS